MNKSFAIPYGLCAIRVFLCIEVQIIVCYNQKEKTI